MGKSKKIKVRITANQMFRYNDTSGLKKFYLRLKTIKLNMKNISKILGRMEASLNGSLDGFELDNTDDVIEKSLVIEMVNDLKMLVNEAQTEVNKISINPPVIKSFCGCEKPKYNYPEMIWCDNCGKEIPKPQNVL